MIYSDAGEGKTTLAAQFPDPLFIATCGEQGVHLHKKNGIIDKKIPVIDLDGPYMADKIPAGGGHEGYIKAIKAMKRFETGNHNRKTLIIDSMSGFEILLVQHTASVLYAGDINGKEFSSYYAGYNDAVSKFLVPEFCRLCLAIVAKGYNVVLLAHSMVKDFKNPTGNDYPRYLPNLYSKAFDALKKDLHAIFFMGRNVTVQADKKKQLKAANESRFLAMSPSCYYVAKCWNSKPGTTEVECGDSPQETYTNLMDALI